MSRNFDRIEIEQKVIKKVDISVILGKFQLFLDHWLFTFIIHTKQQQYIEVQFILENMYVQLWVWLHRTNENDLIVLRERRKY